MALSAARWRMTAPKAQMVQQWLDSRPEPGEVALADINRVFGAGHHREISKHVVLIPN